MRTVKVPNAGNTRGSGKVQTSGGLKDNPGDTAVWTPRDNGAENNRGCRYRGCFPCRITRKTPSRKAAFFPQYSSLIGEYN